MRGPDELDRLSIDTIRTLSMDAVQRANSGHPGTPMALAPVGYCIWQRFLRYDPQDPLWPARDRFVLSAGHASMLLYSLLHLSGVEEVDAACAVTGRPAVTLDDIKAFRQLGSRCPGHPELGVTTGVETTTGPLGQGVATSVGMAMAARWLMGHFGRPGFDMFGFDVYVVASDGDMMEGVSSEAASLAGHLGLSNLCWVYDSNRVTIEGSTELAFSEDVAQRFEAYGWRVERAGDANDLEALTRVLRAFGETEDRPTLVIVDSHIAYGSPNLQDSHKAHGAPLGEEEVRLAKRAYGWHGSDEFVVPEGVVEHFRDGLGARGREASTAWRSRFERYRESYPHAAARFEMVQTGGLPSGWDREMPVYESDAKGVATRSASGAALSAVARAVPWLLGGSADLGPSNKTLIEGCGDLSSENATGRNIHFGVREHAMCAAANGMALAGLRAYAATFLVFSDYARPALRLASLMRLPVVYVFTHDSVGVGEDGPTHQPVEHLASLRAMPGLTVIRPADANEAVEAWRFAMAHTEGPVAMSLTRQAVPVVDRERYGAPDVRRGAYVLVDTGGVPDVLLMATGSEVQLCLEARERLANESVKARVISMPSWELFERQSREYRESVIPSDVPARVAVEAAASMGWERYVGRNGSVLCVDRFGLSAPGDDVFRELGFTVEAVVRAALAQVDRRR